MGLLPPLYIPCPKGAASTLTPKACPTCAPFPQPFYTTRLRQQATTCGGAAPLSPFPFIFRARRALPQPSRQRPVQPGNFSTPLLHNPPAPAGHNLRRSRAPFPFIFCARRTPPQPSRRRRVQPENLRPQSGRQTSAPLLSEGKHKKSTLLRECFLLTDF